MKPIPVDSITPWGDPLELFGWFLCNATPEIRRELVVFVPPAKVVVRPGVYEPFRFTYPPVISVIFQSDNALLRYVTSRINFVALP